jgi:hypothetical protein
MQIHMSPRKRVALLIAIMAALALIIEGFAIILLYRTALEQERARLVEIAQSRAYMIEAVAKFDAEYNQNYPYGAERTILSQIIDAYGRYQGFGKTGEFFLARKDRDRIVFLFSHRRFEVEKPRPVPFESNQALAMRRALSGKSGTLIGPDYRGATVLAAYEPVEVLNLGIVAKIDMAEIRRPFFRAAFYSGVFGLIALLIGTAFFIKVTNPLLRTLYQTIADLQKALAEVKVLSGFLPICASCKKIRDDQGYWNDLEEYIRARSHAEFSHGICPECAQKLYPELMARKKP